LKICQLKHAIKLRGLALYLQKRKYLVNVYYHHDHALDEAEIISCF
jgi:hypothetical protein